MGTSAVGTSAAVKAMPRGALTSTTTRSFYPMNRQTVMVRSFKSMTTGSATGAGAPMGSLLSRNPAASGGPRRALRRWHLDRRAEKRGHRHGQAGGQGVNHRQRRVGVASLDATHVGPKQAASRGQIFLRQAGSQTQFTDASAKGALGRGWHPITLAAVHSFIHTLIHTSERPRLPGRQI